MTELDFWKGKTLPLLFLSLLPFLFTSCSDVLLKPEQQPASLEINPEEVTTIVGEDFNFNISILDEAGQPITDTPAWSDTFFTVSNANILEVRNNSIVAVEPGVASFGVKIADLRGNTNVRAIPRVYLTQSVQRLDGSIPIVAGRDGILRLFLQGEQQELGSQEISIKLFNDGSQFQTLTIPAGTAFNSPVSDNISSVNLPIPGEYIQPGLSISVETANGTVFPEGGSAIPFSVVEVPDFHLRFVPVHVSFIDQTGNISSNNSNEYMEELLDMFPIAGYETDIHSPITTTVSPSDDNFYNSVLNQIDAIRVAEGTSDYYYYGVLPVAQRADRGIIVGLGYIGGRAAIGWDEIPGAYGTLAHELGHNFGRYHAPCGEPAGTDFSYPYKEANIGVYGLEVDENEIKTPTFYKDLMSYCDPVWISDYTYTGVLEYRNSINSNPTSARQAQDVLLVTGMMSNGKITLNPAFRINTVPTLPARAGSYTLSGYDENGSQLFSMSFTGTQISHGGRSFAFAIPVSRVQIDQLAVLQVSGKGKMNQQKAFDSTKLKGLQSKTLPKVEAVRSGANSVELDWESARYQMVMVKNSQTGEVLSFTSEGISDIYTEASELTLYFSDGINTTIKKVPVQ